MMQSLNYLVQSRKVLYLAISDTPAWIVSKANQYARDHGLAQFTVYQGLWSAATRDMERDIIPMARDEGMSIAPWGALGGGKFKTKAQREAYGAEGRQRPPADREVAVTEALDKIAQAKNTHVTSVVSVVQIESSFP
jgi:aryl-alcohol dehydrogenase-like predicted oxidoreductase